MAWSQFDEDTYQALLALQNQAAQPTPPRQNKGALGDVGTSLKIGLEQLPGTVTGLADIPAGIAGFNRPFSRAAEQAGEYTGFQPSKWAEQAQQQYSPAYQEGRQAVNEAWQNGGPGDIAAAYLTHPAQIVNTAVQSLPSMVAGGALGRVALGAAAPALARFAPIAEEAIPTAAGAVGEGLVTAGQNMDQTSAEADPRRAALANLAAGIITGGIGAASGTLARRMGLEDPDTLFAGGHNPLHAPMSLPRRVLGGAVTEGLLEELPQSMQEQVWQNFAEGKPLGTDVLRQGVEGALSGGLMGGSFNAFHTHHAQEAPPPAAELPPGAQATLDLGAPGGPTAPAGEAQQPRTPQEVLTEYREMADIARQFRDAPEGTPQRTIAEQAISRLGDLQSEMRELGMGPKETSEEGITKALGETEKRISKLSTAYDTALQENPDKAGDLLEKLRTAQGEQQRLSGLLNPTPEQGSLFGPSDLTQTTKTAQGKAAPVAASNPDPVLAGIQQSAAAAFRKDGELNHRAAKAYEAYQGLTDSELDAAIKEFSDPAAQKRDGSIPAWRLPMLNAIKDARQAAPVAPEQTQQPVTAQANADLTTQGVENGSQTEVPAPGPAQTLQEGGDGRGRNADEGQDAHAQGQDAADAGVQEGRQGGQAGLLTPAGAQAPAPLQTPKLPKVQQTVFDHMVQAARDNRMDDIVDAEGTLQYAKIGEALGIARGSVKAAVNGAMKRVAEANGTTVEGMKTALRQRAVAQRATETSTEGRLGLSPDQQASHLEDEHVFGEDAGMGIVSSPGGSQIETAPDEEANAVAAQRLDPVAERRAQEARANRQRALDEALAHPEAENAAEEWDYYNEQQHPDEHRPAAELTRLTAGEWALTYLAWKKGIIDDAELLATYHELVDQERLYRPGAGLADQPRLAEPAARSPEHGAPGGIEERPAGREAPQQAAPESTQSPLEQRVRTLRETLGEKQQKGLDKLVGRYADGDISLERLTQGLDEYEAAAQEGVKYSVGQREGRSTVEAVQAALRPLFFSNTRFGSKITIVDTVEALRALPELASVNIHDQVQGFVKSGKAYLVAANIAPGNELSVFLHEVGVHLGMAKLLGPENFRKLESQIVAWASGKEGGQEYTIARKALQRVANAVLKNGSLSDNDRREETIAYFVEEAVRAGINPVALEKVQGPLAAWFRTLWAAVKSALRKFGLDRTEKLSAQDVVNLAYGAARLELEGTYHGTAADFRRFNHDYMGSGEGAQAYGWGTYLAQRPGIAKGYFEADVRRKGSRRSSPEAVRLDDAISDNLSMQSWVQGKISDHGPGSVFVTEMHATYPSREAASAAVQRALWDKQRSLAEYNAALADPNRNASALRRNIEYLKGGIEALQRVDVSKLPTSQEQLDELEVHYQKLKAQADALRPEGAMMRVDSAVHEDEMLDWDKPLSEQSETVKKAFEGRTARVRRKEEVRDQLHDLVSTYLGDKRFGHEVVDAWYAGAGKLVDEARSLGASQEQLSEIQMLKTLIDAWFDRTEHLFGSQPADTGAAAYAQLARDFGSDKAASEYLDSIGIKGIKFLDAQSRRDTGRYVVTAAAYGIQSSKPFVVTDDSGATYGEYDTAAEAEAAIAAHFAANQTRNLVIFNDKSIVRVVTHPGGKRDQVKYSIADNRLTNDIGKVVSDTVLGKGRRLILGLLTRDQLAKRANEISPVLGKAVEEYQAAVQAMGKASREWINKAAPIERQWFGLGKNVDARLAQVMKDATLAYFDPDTEEPTNDRQQAIKTAFDALPKAAQDVYREVRNYFKDSMAERVRTMQALINQTYDGNIAKAQENLKNATGKEGKKAAKLLKDLQTAKAEALKEHAQVVRQMKGPYFPLKRFGQFVAIRMSKELSTLMDAAKQQRETTGNVEAETSKKIEQLRRNKADYEVRSYENEGLQQKQAREWEAQGQVVRTRLAQDFQHENMAVTQSRMNDVADMLAANFDGSTAQAIRNMMAELYIQSLPENHALKRQMRREGIEGATPDMRRAFSAASISDAHYLSRLKYNEDLRKAVFDVRSNGGGTNQATEVANEVAARVAQDMQFNNNAAINTALNVSWLANIGFSPAYILTNMTQAPMITLPWLASKRGVGLGRASKAMWGAMIDAGRLVKASYYPKNEGGKFNRYAELDLSAVANPGERDMLQNLFDKGLLNVTIEHDLGSVAAGSLLPRSAQNAIQALNIPVHLSETNNRLITALAAYRLAAAEGHDAAAKYAEEAVKQTQLDYTAENAPRLMRGSGLARLVSQFKRYSEGMAWLLITQMRDAVGSNAERKTQARKMLGYLFGAQMLMGGVLGLPLPGSLGLLLAQGLGGAAGAGGDGEPWDIEAELRNYLADLFGEEMGRAIAKGVPAALGVDMSKKAGMGDIFNPLSFMRGDAQTGTGWVGNALVAAAGPTASVAANVIDGSQYLGDGQWLKALEKMLPVKFIADASRAYRYGTEGMTTRTGDLALPSERFDGWDLTMRALGFTPSKESEAYAAKSAVMGAETAATKLRSELLRDYARARVNGEDTSDVEDKMSAFNDRHSEQGWRIDYSSKIRAVKSYRDRLNNLDENGIVANKRTKPFEERGRFAEGV